MSRTDLKHIFLAPALLGALALAASAQPFSVRVQLAQSSAIVPDNGSVTLAADSLGAPTAATVTVTYTGTSTAIVAALNLVGSNDFTLASLPAEIEQGVTLRRNESFSFIVRYLPTTSARASARASFGYTEGRTTASVGFNIVGTAPEFVFSYIPQGGNATPVSPGATLIMAQTLIDTTTTTTVVITNRGSGAGLVKTISGGGGAFQLTGLPLPDTTVEAGRELRFGIAFSPKQLATERGTLQIAVSGATAAFNLEGPVSGPSWNYDLIQDSTFSALLPNQLISLPDVIVGEKSSVVVRVRNTGNAEGRIAAISVAGQGFTLSDVPFTPLVLPAGGSATTTVTFAPAQAGRITGRLRIGNDSFELAGQGLAAVLAYSYAIGTTSISVANNGTVLFTPVPVGGSSSVRFVVSNTGTAPASLGSVSITSTNTFFSLSALPVLPATIGPGESLAFSVTFAPTNVGTASASLKLDGQTFNLSATGNQPPALPAYRIEGPTGPQAPLTQPAVGLLLNAPYPLALNGTLTLTFNSAVSLQDPAVQFSTGGRTIQFTIPANSTRAIFANGANQVRVQTGSVAGAIILTPSFVTTEGNINVTPANPPTLSLTVPEQAPQLLSLAITGKTSTAFTLQITGYATNLSVTEIAIQFTATPGETLAATSRTIQAESSFLAWYRSQQAQQFGSLFTATIPFTFSGDVNAVASLVETLQSVSVTLRNALGSSQSRSIDLK